EEFFQRRLGEAARREAHGRAAEYWLFRSDGLEEAYHRIEAGDLETAKARLTEIGPALAESARAGDLEAALLRVPRTARLEGILAEAAAFLGKFDEARAAPARLAGTGPHLDRPRGGPDRARRLRRGQGPAPGGGRNGPAGDEGRGGDSDQSGHRHEQGRRPADGGRHVRAIRGNGPRDR